MMPVSLNQSFDSSVFRGCLSEFATGVTVIATMNEQGNPVGLTANSFCSVSLVPPLVSWCLSANSFNRQVFEHATYFSVNVLAQDQVSIAHQFASKIPNRFENVAWHQGQHNMPLLEGCSAWFECRKKQVYVEGDHLIYIGEVLALGRDSKTPLLYYHGKMT